jgi:hypothetical protein
MVKPVPRCPKCQGSMERGYVADVGYSMVNQSGWSRGEPEPRRRFFGGIKWRRSESIPIVCLRCIGCGYLESYAPST